MIIYNFLIAYSQPSLSISSIDKTKCSGNPCSYSGPSILINEIMLGPSSFDGCLFGNNAGVVCQGEWIELYNPDFCNDIDISCYFLGNSTEADGGVFGGGFTIPPGTIVHANGFAIVRGENAPPVPSNLLYANGGKTIEIIVSDSNNVCLGGGIRLWFPNYGGWFAFYDRNGIPQDAISWAAAASTSAAPCNPLLSSCAYAGQLLAYDLIDANRKTYISDIEPVLDYTFKRNPDGADWLLNTPSNPTYGTCNDVCITSPPITCDGKGFVTASGGSGSYSYLWDNGNNTTNVLDLCTGIHTVTVTDNITNLSSTATITINDPPNPNVNINPSLSTICAGTEQDLTASGAINYLWSGDSLSSTSGNIVSVNPTSNTTYTVTGTDANLCSATSSTIVNVNPVPIIDAIPNQYLCEGFATNLIQFNTSPSADSYKWTNSNTTIGLAANGTGNTIPSFITSDVISQQTSIITITPTIGLCEGTPIQFIITVNPIPIASAGLDDTICSGKSTQLNGSGGTSCIWNPSSGLSDATDYNAIATPSNTTNYKITVWENGCSATDEMILSYIQSPVANAGNDISICEGEETTLNASGGNSYLWQNTTSLSSLTICNPIANPSISSTYIVNAFSNGCSDIDSVVVTVIPLPIVTITANPSSICKGDICVIDATSSVSYNGGTNYLWNNYSSDAQISVRPETNTIYTVTAFNSICTDTASIFIEVKPLPTINMNSDTNSGCTPVIINFSNTSHPTPDNYLWNFGDGTTSTVPNPSHTFIEPGYYDISLTVTSNGCSTSFTNNQMIFVDAIPDLDFYWQLLYGELIYNVAKFTSVSTENLTNFVWTFGDSLSYDNISYLEKPTHIYSTPDFYSVELCAENMHGCRNCVSHEVQIKDIATFYIPNAFTPDGNNLNEEFGPILYYVSDENYEFQIFNRWGEMIFETTDPTIFWNGRPFNKGEICPIGVYTWMIKYEEKYGKTMSKKGMVLLTK